MLEFLSEERRKFERRRDTNGSSWLKGKEDEPSQSSGGRKKGV
jgi:hypothetical protein